MLKWFLGLFGSRPAATPPELPVPAPVARTREAASRPAADDGVPAAPAALLTAAQVEFLNGLIEAEPLAPKDATKDDQLFLAGILKRWHTHKLEMPVLPRAAIRLGAMVRQGTHSVAQIVSLLEGDPALSVDVLKAANSALYGNASQTTSLREAILRIGAQRLQGILIMAHMKAKVLRGGAFQGKAELLMDLALPLGGLASTLAKRRQAGADLCFVRGMLLHVEHMVILGALADISRDHKRAIAPSVAALHDAFIRFGPDIRRVVATAWQLEDILLGGEGEDGLADEYAQLRHALVWRWLGRPLPTLDGLDPEVLDAALADVSARVKADRAA